jgi:hypothetical protein
MASAGASVVAGMPTQSSGRGGAASALQLARSGGFPSVSRDSSLPSASSPAAAAAQQRLRQQLEATAPHAAFLERLTPPTSALGNSARGATAPSGSSQPPLPPLTRTQAPAAAVANATTSQFQAPSKAGRGAHAARLAAARKGEQFASPSKGLQLARSQRARLGRLRNAAGPAGGADRSGVAVTGAVKVAPVDPAGIHAQVAATATTAVGATPNAANAASAATESDTGSSSVAAAPASKLGARLGTFGSSGHNDGSGAAYEDEEDELGALSGGTSAAEVQRKMLSSLRLRVELLWEELHVPMRDRRAVLSAKVTACTRFTLL